MTDPDEKQRGLDATMENEASRDPSQWCKYPSKRV